jgi:transposase
MKKKAIVKTKNLNELIDEPEGIDIHGKWVYVVFHTSGQPRHSKLYRFNLK